MSLSLTSWLCRSQSARLARSPARARLAAETLEEREVPAAVAPPGGVVSWWTGDNTAADLEGLNNASLVSGATYAGGMVGQAFSLDGADDRVQMADSNSLKLTQSLTIEGWVKVDAFPASDHGEILFRGDDRGGLDPYSLATEPDGTLNFHVESLSGVTELGAPIDLGRFVHVAVTLDDTTGSTRIYLDGSLAAQTVTTVRPFGDLDPASNPGVGIGNHGGYPNTPHNFPFHGLIDELAIYNRALTAAEIGGIHAAGSSGKVKVANYIAAGQPEVAEGASSVTFTLTRVGSTGGLVTVSWATADRTATAGADYVAASGQVVFQPGETAKTVTVNLLNDAVPETTETFWLTVSTPTPGWAAGSGLATLTDDDIGVSVGDVTVVEGAAGYGSRGALVDQSANGGLNRSSGMVWGPDGNLYVGSLNGDAVLRFDGTTGQLLGTFIGPESGLDSPAGDGLRFHTDGKLYVLSRDQAEVRRYDAVTGTFLDVFIPSGSGGLAAATGLTVGPDGNWYVGSGATNQILRYSGTTGAFLGAFVAAGSGGLNQPRIPTFGPDGNLYVSNAMSGAGTTVLRYNGQTGAFLGTFVTGSAGLLNPGGLLFSGGSLFVASQNTNEVHRYDALTGAFLDKVVTAGLDGLDRPVGLLLDASGNLLVGGFAEINGYGPGATAVFTVSLSSTSTTPVTVNYTTANGTATAGSDYTAVSGTVTFAPGQRVKAVVVPILNDAAGENTEAFTLTLSSPVGATITDGAGAATILDDETKFYVVDDASGNRTYEYGSGGGSGENYALNGGNAAPRGAASTAAGDKVWVADANKTVYVYSPAGTLLGSWAAGSLAANATVEGITVWGSDVWLVDATQDKVFKYAGAATRLSGSQNAAGSFNLNGSNGSPTDLVTDGTSVWVVNDAANDKVFKYSLTGSLLGSWTMTGAGGSPTGITLDPSGASQDLWVVDNATDRVYSYAGARSRTSGSQAAAASFALAAGNTNPQGIADPPSPAPSGSGSGGRPVAADSHAKPTALATDAEVTPRLGFDRGAGRPADPVVRVNGFAAPAGATLVGDPVSGETDGATAPTNGWRDDIAWGVAVDSPSTVSPSDRSRSVHLAGTYHGTADFDPDPNGTSELTVPGTDFNGYVVRRTQG
jgi:hypothetical protein